MVTGQDWVSGRRDSEVKGILDKKEAELEPLSMFFYHCSFPRTQKNKEKKLRVFKNQYR